MFTNKDTQIIETRKADMRRTADQSRLAQLNRKSSNYLTWEPTPQFNYRWAVKGLVIVLVLASILIGAGSALVGGPDPLAVDSGDAELFGAEMVAYREGRYALNHGDYEQAIIEFTTAIDGLPAEIFTQPGYADMYWFIGEAYESLGQYAAALANYEQFLSLVGDIASPYAIDKVAQLELTVNAMVAEVEIANLD